MRKLIDQAPFDTQTHSNNEAGQSEQFDFKPKSQTYTEVHVSKAHESAARHVSGTARYVDDIPSPANLLHAAVGSCDAVVGKITNIDVSDVLKAPGVIDVITAQDVPGHVDIAPVFDGDPVLADGEIKFHDQPVFAVLANSVVEARRAAKLGKVEFEANEPTLTIDKAHADAKYVRPSHHMQIGTPIEAAFQSAEFDESATLKIGGQEHMYLEGQVSMAIPEEEDRMFVYTSSQHPSEVQKLVAEVLDTSLNKVTVDMRRMGGGFGGKETQAAQWACIAALFAARQRKAVKLRLPRQQDLTITGKRHPFENHCNIAFDKDGRIHAAKLDINGDCGHSADLSDAIVDRAMFHADNCYFIENCVIDGHRLQTNYVSHTAYRGFGGPQGMIMGEYMMDIIARKTKQDPLSVRKLNLYGHNERDITPYGMKVEHNVIAPLIDQLEASSEYWLRRKQITEFNRTSPVIKKGLAFTPVKFGISFTAKHLNQAGALVHVYTDGSIQANHGGTEMGQGLHTKIGQIVANEFGVSLDKVDVTSTRTDKVPNTSPTAASSGTDLNGKAAQNACLKIKAELAKFYAGTLEQAERFTEVIFENGKVCLGDDSVDFVDLVQDAYMNRVSLSANGFYKTPKIHYNRETGKGRPFFYFAYGASVSEVSVDCLTGEYKVDRVDILHDVGNSLNPAIDVGQIEGAFIQGMGWLTTEDLKWNEQGKLISNNMATYKIPAIGDTPEVFNVALFDRKNDEDSIYHSKAVGEPPFMLAMSVWCAIKDAISSLSDYSLDPQLDTPATAERVLNAIEGIQSQYQKSKTR